MLVDADMMAMHKMQHLSPFGGPGHGDSTMCSQKQQLLLLALTTQPTVFVLTCVSKVDDLESADVGPKVCPVLLQSTGSCSVSKVHLVDVCNQLGHYECVVWGVACIALLQDPVAGGCSHKSNKGRPACSI